MALRFHLDEHVASAVAEALRRRGIDVTTTQEAGLLGATDRQQLDYARAQQRVVHSNDSDFLLLAAAGEAHPGIVYCEVGSRTLGQIVEYLILMHVCYTPEDMNNRIEFI